MKIRNCKRLRKVLQNSCYTYRPKLCSEKKKKSKHTIEKNQDIWATPASHSVWLPRGTNCTNLFSWLKGEQMCLRLFHCVTGKAPANYWGLPTPESSKALLAKLKIILWAPGHEGAVPGHPGCRQPRTCQLWPAHRTDVARHWSPHLQAACALCVLHSPSTPDPLWLQVPARPEEEERLFQPRSLAGGCSPLAALPLTLVLVRQLPV